MLTSWRPREPDTIQEVAAKAESCLKPAKHGTIRLIVHTSQQLRIHLELLSKARLLRPFQIIVRMTKESKTFALTFRQSLTGRDPPVREIKALWENTVFRSLLTMVEEHETKQNYTPCYLGEKIQCFRSLLTMVELGVQLVRSQEEKCWDRELKPESSLIGPYLRVKQKYKTQLMLLFAREEVYVLSIQRNTKLPFLPPRCFPSPLHFSLKNLKFSNQPMFGIINIRPYESHEDPLAGVMVQECYR